MSSNSDDDSSDKRVPEIVVDSSHQQQEQQASQSTRLNASLLRLKLLDSLRNNDANKLLACYDESRKQTEQDPHVASVLSLLLHYAVQVAPLAIVQFIVSKGLVDDVNIQDKDGNTPLHLAVHSSRYEIVNYLMSLPQINDCVVNYAGKQALELTDDLGMIQLMSDLRTRFVEAKSNELRQAFESKDFGTLAVLLSSQRVVELLDINGMDPVTGDGVLHEFVRKDDLTMCKFILEHGGDPFKRNMAGKLPVDLASSSQMKKLLKESSKEQSIIDPMGNGSNLSDQPPTYKGFLKKWTNFAGGYKLRWFVLDADGRLSYYKSPTDINKNCRGAINLSNARLRMDSSEKSKFEIEIPSTQSTSIRWHLKSNHYIEANRWVWFLQNAIRYTKDAQKEQRLAQQQQQNQGQQQALSPTTGNGARSQKATARNRESFDSNRSNDTSNINQPQNKTHQRMLSSGSMISVSSYSDTDSEPVDNSDIVQKKNSRVKKLKNKLTPGGGTYNNKKLLEEIDENNRLRVNRHQQQVSQQQAQAQQQQQQPQQGQLLSGTSSLVSNSRANSIHSNSPSSRSGNFFSTSVSKDNDPASFESDAEDEEDQASVDALTGDIIERKPGAQGSKIIVLQNNLQIEVASLKEFFQNSSSVSAEDVQAVCSNTLTQIEKLLQELKIVIDSRDEKLLKKINRQKEISTLWENSIKTLEFEMREREQKIVALEDKQNHLKKILKQNFGNGPGSATPTLEKSVSDVTAPAVAASTAAATTATTDDLKDAELAKFLEEAGDESDDEFFDAEGDDEVVGTAPPPPSSIATAKSAALTAREPSAPEAESEQTTLNDGTVAADSSKTVEQPESAKRESKSANRLQDEKLELIAKKEGSFKGYEDPIRKRLAMDEDNRPKISLWGILKSMVGKDMTKMTLPVSFNEPTSLLQRVAEDMEYTDLLDKAAAQSDSTLRMVYIAAFAASEYASTINRIAKPFNPLLGETYEYSRPDKNYRFLVEQVSHHPPIGAAMAESPYWDYYGESFVKSKFYGRSFDIKPLGSWFLNLRPNEGSINAKTGVHTKEELYTWKKVTSSVIGIIVGNPTVDNYGDMEIVNHNTGDSILFQFKARGWRESSAYEVKGTVLDKRKQPRWQVQGHWNSKIFAKRIDPKAAPGTSSSSEKFLVWQAHPRPKIPFNLTEFATSLNAPQKSLVSWLPRTDTRFRPDQRAMEEGRYDDAATDKNRVEEKQRAAKRKRDAKGEEYKPLWFSKKKHPVTGEEYWHFSGDYWGKRFNKDFSQVPDIF